MASEWAFAMSTLSTHLPLPHASLTAKVCAATRLHTGNTLRINANTTRHMDQHNQPTHTHTCASTNLSRGASSPQQVPNKQPQPSSQPPAHRICLLRPRPRPPCTLQTCTCTAGSQVSPAAPSVAPLCRWGCRPPPRISPVVCLLFVCLLFVCLSVTHTPPR